MTRRNDDDLRGGNCIFLGGRVITGATFGDDGDGIGILNLSDEEDASSLPAFIQIHHLGVNLLDREVNQ